MIQQQIISLRGFQFQTYFFAQLIDETNGLVFEYKISVQDTSKVLR